ncbi:hypothetical protein GGR56DRAFT_567189 [Xylariaceae sp. FL0804]|nr:hypothetical protein GGR56DRAFT_567189 [Xylariaceae sp. FL0804]
MDVCPGCRPRVWAPLIIITPWAAGLPQPRVPARLRGLRGEDRAEAEVLAAVEVTIPGFPARQGWSVHGGICSLARYAGGIFALHQYTQNTYLLYVPAYTVTDGTTSEAEARRGMPLRQRADSSRVFRASSGRQPTT